LMGGIGVLILEWFFKRMIWPAIFGGHVFHDVLAWETLYCKTWLEAICSKIALF
jgi:hypothetical protein